ncbi:MAG: colicin import membrane protein [Flavobacteriales bacterium]|jgi:colicin import membrane protein
MKKSITLLAALAIVGSMSAQVSKETDKLKKEKATSEQSLKDEAKKTDQETRNLRQKSESEKDHMNADSKSKVEQAKREAMDAREKAGADMDKAKGDMRDAKEEMRDAKDAMKDAKEELTSEQKEEIVKRREQANAERTRILKEHGTTVNMTKAETKRITESSREELMKLPPVERKEAMQVKAAQELAISKEKLKNGRTRISAAVEKLNTAKADGSMTTEEIESMAAKIIRAKKATGALQEKIKAAEQSLRGSN